MVTALGWIGAVLALAAYAQTGTARLRQIALASSLALLTFNALLGIWSNVVLESALVAVNIRRLLQLRVRSRPARWLPQRAGVARSVLLECPRWDSNPHALSDNGF